MGGHKKGSVLFIVLGVSVIFLACCAVAVLLLGSFAAHNYGVIKTEADCIAMQDDVVQTLASSNYSPQHDGKLRDLIKSEIPADGMTATLGKPISLEGVSFDVRPSGAAIRDPEAAASVDIEIANNSDETVTLPMDATWSAFCSKGAKLKYTWDSWGEDAAKNQQDAEVSGVIAPGDTYRITLLFYDDSGEVADALIVLTTLNEPLDGIAGIYWCFEVGESSIY
ncbi:MAG: hypothetical protein FWE48_03885 [Coriobacteriia bacterium]|nr:hypothetical protein [Coriobacteriia bacterium]MCL2746216.1 hypothetical protein [Coriobacteriia bacterium]MCL2870920.1 hypothetical protein [Coriobacteriia bacterium]